MREIKFRFWLEGSEWADNQMVSWDAVLNSPYGIEWFKNDASGYSHPLQFTGLHDRNGKEIYEGDIVKSYWNGKAYPLIFGTCELRDSRGECEGFFDGLIWGNTPFGRDAYGNTDHYEVIGNVYETPELLEANQ